MRLDAGRLRDEPEISLTSLIDVVFTLIIFFVVTTTFDERAALQLQLPRADAPTELQPDPPLVLVVDMDGRYFLGEEEVIRRDTASLREAIERYAGPDRERPVVLRADARAQHQSVITAMEALGQLGFNKVHMATTPGEQ